MTGVVLLVAGSAVSPTQAVYHGERAPFGSFGFMVSLRPPEHPNLHLCGGTLIAPDIVLSAAHCLGRANPKRLTAIVGADKPDWREARKVPITGYRVAPRFSLRSSNRNDLVLLRLARAQPGSVVGLADAEPRQGASVTTAGWGCTDRPRKPWKCRRHPSHLQAAQQRVVSDSRCNRSTFWNPPAHTPSSICAKGSDAVSNLGDSGGPLLVGDPEGGFAQVGVVSLLADKPKAPLNAYTSVPTLQRWIDRAVARLSAGG